jgi:hypothetical protein
VPLFTVAALVAALVEAGIWHVDAALMWIVIVAGVLIAFMIEWRRVPRRKTT